MKPILLALTANLFFGTATIYFTIYTRIFSSLFVNLFKAAIATIGFGIIYFIFTSGQTISTHSILLFSLSGALGLMIGDIFLLKAFTRLGAGRTLMVFGFQPLFIGLFAFFLFDQSFPVTKLIAVFFLILCLLSFSLESFHLNGHWEVRGLLYAGLGVLLDGSGVLLTRLAFEDSPGISPFGANFIRSMSATVGFLLFGLGAKVLLNSDVFNFKEIGLKKIHLKGLALASFFGTFFSLSLYLLAIQEGHLASLSAIAGTSPMIATLIETIKGHRPLTRHLLFGVFFFLIGLGLLISNPA